MGKVMFLNVLMEVAGILNESGKLFIKNKKLMFSVLLFPLFLNCLVYLLNIISIKSEITNILNEAIYTDIMGNAAQLMIFFNDFRQLVSSTYIFVVVASIISLFFTLAIVHASAITLKEDNIAIKEFLALAIRSWKRPLVTSFYIFLFKLGLMFLFIITLFPLLIFSTNLTSSIAKTLFLWIIFTVFESYLAIVWYLSLIISILEETYGIQALGKAAKIAKGMKLNLLFLNLLFVLMSFGLAQIVKLIDPRQSFAITLATGLVLVCLIFVVNMFMLVTYTTAYFKCKSLQGKDVELQKDVEYMELPSTAFMGTLP